MSSTQAPPEADRESKLGGSKQAVREISWGTAAFVGAVAGLASTLLDFDRSISMVGIRVPRACVWDIARECVCKIDLQIAVRVCAGVSTNECQRKHAVELSHTIRTR